MSFRRHGWLLFAAAPALVLGGVLACSVIESIKGHQVHQSTHLDYDPTRKEWRKIRVTNTPTYCTLEVSACYPWIYLYSCPHLAEEVVPMGADDDCSWVGRVPRSQEMDMGMIYEMRPGMQGYDANARWLLIMRIPDKKTGVIRPWFKLMNDGTIAEIK